MCCIKFSLIVFMEQACEFSLDVLLCVEARRVSLEKKT